MNSSRPLRLLLAPLALGLTLTVAGTGSAHAAREKKNSGTAAGASSAARPKSAPQPGRRTAAKPAAIPAPPPATAAPAPVPEKRSFFKKLNPFRKKEALPEVPSPEPPATGNSKKSRPADRAGAPVPARSLAGAKTLKPGPPVPDPARPRPASAGQAKPLPGAVADARTEETATDPVPKKSGFFSRLRARLDRDRDAPAAMEKPERPADWKERWVVSEDSTAFFEFGPSQASGPDLRLPKGQVVKLLEGGRGWARVELDGGRQGYIGTDQMRQAAETDFSDVLLPPADTRFAATGPLPQPWAPAAPLPDLPDVPMAPGTENSSLLLPPLEFEGTELKKSSLKIGSGPASPILLPGDLVPGQPVPEVGAGDLPNPDSTETKPGTPPEAPAPLPEPAASAAEPSSPSPAPATPPPASGTGEEAATAAPEVPAQTESPAAPEKESGAKSG